MNIQVLNNYLATQLHSIVRIYSDKKITDTISMRIDLDDSDFYHTYVEPSLLHIPATSMPVLFSVNDHFVYGKVEIPDFIYIIGPVYSSEVLSFRYKQNADTPEKLFQQTPVCLLTAFINQLLLLHNLHAQNEVKFWDCLNENCLDATTENAIQTKTSEQLFHNREYGSYHNPYEQEQRELSSIEQGDLIQLKNSWNEQYSGSFGLTSSDPFRNGKNLAIIVVSLATRAAIRGGILPEEALSLGDNFMLRIDETRNPYEIGSLVKEAEYTLTQMVKEKKSRQAVPAIPNSNVTISRCKDYVFAHLHGKITVQKIADSLYLHPNYLSALFKKNEGISLYQYITNEKISLTKNLLIYSQYSFSQISSYLGFTSQSHLGKAFKKATGYTLKEYRNTFAKSEFLS